MSFLTTLVISIINYYSFKSLLNVFDYKKSRGDNTPKNFPIQLFWSTLKRVIKMINYYFFTRFSR